MHLAHRGINLIIGVEERPVFEHLLQTVDVGAGAVRVDGPAGSGHLGLPFVVLLVNGLGVDELLGGEHVLDIDEFVTIGAVFRMGPDIHVLIVVAACGNVVHWQWVRGGILLVRKVIYFLAHFILKQTLRRGLVVGPSPALLLHGSGLTDHDELAGFVRIS